MIRSLVTLASTDAAATDAQRASPPITVFTGGAQTAPGDRAGPGAHRVGLDRALGVEKLRHLRRAHEVEGAVEDHGVGNEVGASWSRARRVASRSAAVIPSRSHSSGPAWPTAQPAHHAATRSNMASLVSSVSCLESRSPFGIRRGDSHSTTTPTLSGPAQAPRPTSSIPATTR